MVLVKKTVSFTVNRREDFLKIFEHFDTYPLKSYKLRNYLLFKEVFFLVNDKKITKEEDILNIVSIVDNINLPLSEKLRLVYPILNEVSLPKLPENPVFDPNWITGFTDGDGTFCVRRKKRLSSKIGEYFDYYNIFQIKLHRNDGFLIDQIRNYFNSGRVNHNEFSSFTCVAQSEIKTIIIPHFEKYPLLSARAKDYIIFKEIFNLIESKPSDYKLRIEELLEIINNY